MPDRVQLFDELLSAAASQIYAEYQEPLFSAERTKQVLMKHASDPATLLLIAEVESPAAVATKTSPAGFSEAGVLLTLPWTDPLADAHAAWLRVLFTFPNYRNRGFAKNLLQRAEEILRTRGVASLRVDPLYGDDSIVGIFERREYERGRMWLRRDL